METDMKQFHKHGHDCFRRCGKLTLKANNELDATLLAMLGRAITNDNKASRAKLYKSLMAEFPDHEQPDDAIVDELRVGFVPLGQAI